MPAGTMSMTALPAPPPGVPQFAPADLPPPKGFVPLTDGAATTNQCFEPAPLMVQTSQASTFAVDGITDLQTNQDINASNFGPSTSPQLPSQTQAQSTSVSGISDSQATQVAQSSPENQGALAPTAKPPVFQGDAITGDELAAALRGVGPYPAQQNVLASGGFGAANFSSMPAGTMSMTALPAPPPSVPQFAPANVPPPRLFVPLAGGSATTNQCFGPVSLMVQTSPASAFGVDGITGLQTNQDINASNFGPSTSPQLPSQTQAPSASVSGINGSQATQVAQPPLESQVALAETLPPSQLIPNQTQLPPLATLASSAAEPPHQAFIGEQTQSQPETLLVPNTPTLIAEGSTVNSPPPPPPPAPPPQALLPPGEVVSGQASQLRTNIQESQSEQQNHLVWFQADSPQEREKGDAFEVPGDLYTHRGIDGELLDDGLSDIFSRVDTNSDGLITRAEFLRAVNEQRLLIDQGRIHIGAGEWKPGMGLGLDDQGVEGEVTWDDRMQGVGEFRPDQSSGRFEGGSAQYECSGARLNGPQVQYDSPGGRSDAPNSSAAGYSDLRMGFGSPAARSDAPNSSAAGYSDLRMGFGPPGARFDAPNGSGAGFNDPRIGFDSPGTRLDGPNARVGGPEVDFNAPGFRVDGPSTAFNGLGVDLDTLGLRFDGPSATFGSCCSFGGCLHSFRSLCSSCAHAFRCCLPCFHFQAESSEAGCIESCGCSGDCGDNMEVWCVDSLQNCMTWCFGRETARSHATTVSNIFPWLFTLLCVILFASPIMQVSRLAGDMQVQYWICGRLNVVLILPLLYAFTQFMHTMQRRPNRKLISVCLVGSCLLLLLVSNYVMLAAKHHATVLLSKDCATFKKKTGLNKQRLNAEYFYKQCINVTARNTRGTANVAFALYRIQDCQGYQEQLALNPDWPYLGALEHTYQCGGWCTRGEPLWTFKSVKDSCSLTVADVLFHRVQWCMKEVVGYTVIVLLLVSSVLIQVGAIFRTYNVTWK
eukprot:TRINITY_DN5717_c0_g1_i1.p1 TRINITY_DN5717_c0_g1~~TRINITY_DN5717_c0_g1_i1.p1  ORF type:complete len:1057 (+),score=149.32 TRINITY_DN5717_c0_g1_i1:196-3171(+)